MIGSTTIPHLAHRADNPLLKVDGLRTYFPVRRGLLGRNIDYCRAVDGVSFELARGTTMGLVGESGCGKTTLGRTLLRLVHPTAGRVLFNGTDVLTAPPAIMRRLRRDMQIVFQDPLGSLNPRMKVGTIIAEPLQIHKLGSALERRVKAADLLERVGLRSSDADRYPHEFSGGQRQRIGIARAIALNPKFLVCDEPVSALDVSIQAQIINLLDDLKQELGLTLLFIAHNLALVRHVSDRVAVMYLGKIVEIAEADELFTRPGHPYTVALLRAVPEPDPRCRTAPIELQGEPPSPMDPPTGCSFHPRCPVAGEECRKVVPPLERKTGLSPLHFVACHYPDRLPAGAGSAAAPLAGSLSTVHPRATVLDKKQDSPALE